MNMKSFIPTLLAAMAMLLIAGCDEDKYSLRFSHALHVTENGMDCSDCHGDLGEPSFKPLSHETCADCHDEVAAEEINAKTCGICHEAKLLPELKDWKAEPATPKRNIFVHSEALAGKCQECHQPLMAENLTSVPLLERNDILKIRDEAHSSGQECQTCHVGMDPSQPPVGHDQLWMKRHGQFGSQDDAACSVCHSEDSCRECHSVMEPASHNNMWRLQTHGVMASWDRATCMVCHYEDSCQSCHSQASPRSHRGQWSANSKYPTHCIGCHTSATAGDGCITCHENGNDVLLHEDFWPASHDLFGNQLNCYDCHMYPKFNP